MVNAFGYIRFKQMTTGRYNLNVEIQQSIKIRGQSPLSRFTAQPPQHSSDGLFVPSGLTIPIE